ncbi:MAG: hypothetical protein ACD_2C00264G0001 [uncultured bacterium (gcode 4)]|uniref:DUF475 domain-containing protein n=1 Tax=uncultured bacterium (gcode 4) TaxID=1234023 RepID=K2FCT5_9BACT|nr:MAG: hypothetical protein ACD_2C00264G0001 [uncultured bacterium (gcode 4)]
MFLSSIFVIVWLCIFEIINSIDNAIINAEVLSTMKPKYRRWFLIWWILIAVFLVRWILPWLIVYATAPGLWFFGSLTATFNWDPATGKIIEQSAPILMIWGWIFLVFLFFHWLFLEAKNFWLVWERFFYKNWVWFYAIVSLILSYVVWKALHTSNPILAFWAVIGSTTFFITHWFKESAEAAEKNLMKEWMSDISKIMYLEVIDATFSIDWVLWAFAFTMSVPLILLWNWIWAIVVRQITIWNIDRIKKYVFLKNWAMYSIFFLWLFMLLKWFWFKMMWWTHDLSEYMAPIITSVIIIYFFMKSSKAIKKQALEDAMNMVEMK